MSRRCHRLRLTTHCRLVGLRYSRRRNFPRFPHCMSFTRFKQGPQAHRPLRFIWKSARAQVHIPNSL